MANVNQGGIRLVPRYLRRQRESNYTFHQYRQTGRLDADITCPECLYFRVPRNEPQYYSGPEMPQVNPDLEAFPVPRTSPRRQSLHLEQARARLCKRLEPYRLRWVKDLGHGGFGLASLFRLHEPGRSTPPKYYVAKTNYKEERVYVLHLEDEKLMTKTFKGAMHIVRVRLFPPYQKRVVRGSARLRAQPDYVPPDYKQAENDQTGTMLLEYYPRGSLDKAIQAAVKKDMRFPTRGLWKLFQCLVKGCIAMAYEPAKYPTLYNGAGPHDELMMPTATAEKTVHFDLDPQNVLVGANTAPGTAHALFPVLKISDFGLAQYFNDEYLQEDDNMYRLRHYGKANFLTPEQFTGEWDYIPRNSGPGTVQTPNAIPVVAGNWSYKYNLFQVGWIMGCLLERSYPPVPPFAQRIAVPWRLVNPLYYHGEPNSYPTRYGPGENTQARQHDGNVHPDGTRIPNTLDKVSAYSYGEYLVDHDSNKTHDHNRLDVDRVGPRLENRQDRGSPLPEPAPPMYADESFLRDLVAMCLCEKPYYRPSLTWLQKEIETFMEKFYGRINEEDENNQENKDLRDFVREIFDRPPPPPPPPPPAAARKKRRNMKGKYPTDAQLAKDRKEKRQKKQEREAQLQAEQEARDRQRQLDAEEEQDGAEDGEQNQEDQDGGEDQGV